MLNDAKNAYTFYNDIYFSVVTFFCCGIIIRYLVFFFPVDLYIIINYFIFFFVQYKQKCSNLIYNLKTVCMFTLYSHVFSFGLKAPMVFLFSRTHNI